MSSSASTRSRIRSLIFDRLRTDSDLNAFCLDFFPEVHARFALGMDRVDKINLLLQLVKDLDEIRKRLEEACPDAASPTQRRFGGWIVAALLIGAVASGVGFLVYRTTRIPPARLPIPQAEAPSAPSPKPPPAGINSGNQIIGSPGAKMVNEVVIKP